MNIVRLCLIASAGGALEFFDFTIFMLFSPFIAAAYFPASDSLAGTMSVVLLFLTGYVARPLGGIIAGHFGDCYGRKKLFILTISSMSFATLGIGLLPSYDQWGEVSLWLLVLFRLTQGLAVGGELPGSTIFAAEHVQAQRRGLVTGSVIAAVTFGNVVGASLGWWLNKVLAPEDMAHWGWRIPFLLGGILGFLGLQARKALLETPIFLGRQDSARLPFLCLMNSAWKEALAGMVYASVTATTVSVFLYLPIFFNLSKVEGISSYQVTTLMFLCYSLLTIPFAWLSDYVGRRRQLMTGAALMMSICLLSAWYADLGDNTAIFFWLLLVTISGAIINGAYEAAIIELFPTQYRYSGVAFSHNLGFVLFGGVTPVILTSLAQSGISLLPVLLLAPVSLMLWIVSWLMPCRSSQSLESL